MVALIPLKCAFDTFAFKVGIDLTDIVSDRCKSPVTGLVLFIAKAEINKWAFDFGLFHIFGKVREPDRG